MPMEFALLPCGFEIYLTVRYLGQMSSILSGQPMPY